MELAPVAREMLGIPSDHYMKLIVGFGYPEIEYARGVQKIEGIRFTVTGRDRSETRKWETGKTWILWRFQRNG